MPKIFKINKFGHSKKHFLIGDLVIKTIHDPISATFLSEKRIRSPNVSFIASAFLFYFGINEERWRKSVTEQINILIFELI